METPRCVEMRSYICQWQKTRLEFYHLLNSATILLFFQVKISLDRVVRYRESLRLIAYVVLSYERLNDDIGTKNDFFAQVMYLGHSKNKQTNKQKTFKNWENFFRLCVNLESRSSTRVKLNRLEIFCF